jgi:hypothetical protein
MIPQDDGMMFLHMGIRKELNGISGFVPIEDVRNDLQDKGLDFLLDKHDTPWGPTPFDLALLKVISQSLLVVLCAWAFRKQLFGK